MILCAFKIEDCNRVMISLIQDGEWIVDGYFEDEVNGLYQGVVWAITRAIRDGNKGKCVPMQMYCGWEYIYDVEDWKGGQDEN